MVAIRQKYARTTINSGQIKILELVYKYRFVSRQLLAGSLGVNPNNGLYTKLEILVSHGYLGKRLEKRLTLDNIPAAYYVAPKGLKCLQALPGHDYIDDQAYKESYRDKSTTGFPFIRHLLNAYKQTQALQTQYPELKVFMPRELRRYTYFPDKLPDAFLSLPSDDPEKPHRFFFDIVRDRQPRSVLIQKIKTYTEFFDDGGWDETESDLPALLLHCEWSPSERSVQRMVRRQLSQLYSDLDAYTSTTDTLKAAELASWTNVYDRDEPVSLYDVA